MKIMQDGRALVRLLEREEYGLVVVVLTGKGILKLEDDVVDLEISHVGHDVGFRGSGQLALVTNGVSHGWSRAGGETSSRGDTTLRTALEHTREGGKGRASASYKRSTTSGERKVSGRAFCLKLANDLVESFRVVDLGIGEMKFITIGMK